MARRARIFHNTVFSVLFFAGTILLVILFTNDQVLASAPWWGKSFFLFIGGAGILAGTVYWQGNTGWVIWPVFGGFCVLCIFIAGLVVQHLAGVPGY